MVLWGEQMFSGVFDVTMWNLKNSDVNAEKYLWSQVFGLVPRLCDLGAWMAAW